MSTMFHLQDASVVQGVALLVYGVNMDVEAGAIIGIIGPNGAGKSSLLKALAGLLPYQGVVEFKHQPLERLKPHQRAQHIAYVEQTPSVAWALSVREVVELGRLPFTAQQQEADERAVTQAMQLAGTTHLRDRRVDTLSGGEFARVMLARALATDAEVLLLDEPFSGLDLRYQLEIAACLKTISEQGKTVLFSLHDLNIASDLCHRVLLLNRAQPLGFASVAHLQQQGKLEDAFGVKLTTLAHGARTWIASV